MELNIRAQEGLIKVEQETHNPKHVDRAVTTAPDIRGSMARDTLLRLEPSLTNLCN